MQRIALSKAIFVFIFSDRSRANSALKRFFFYLLCGNRMVTTRVSSPPGCTRSHFHLSARTYPPHPTSLSLFGVGTVLRLERGAWSMVRLLRHATNEYAHPPPHPTSRARWEVVLPLAGTPHYRFPVLFLTRAYVVVMRRRHEEPDNCCSGCLGCSQLLQLMWPLVKCSNRSFK